MDAIGLLTEFGLTRQEATLYLCLLSEGDQNGYELAKKTGISRSNSYTGLAGLVEKGAAWTLEGETIRYRAVAGAEFTGNCLRRWERLQKKLLPLLPVLRDKSGSYVTVRGKAAILDRMRNLVAGTRERLYVSLSHELLGTLIPELAILNGRGCKLVVLSDPAGCAMAAKNCGKAVVHASDPGPGQIRLIVDSLHVMTGEISETGESSCLYSDHHNLVELFKSSLKNEIRLAGFEKGGKRSRKSYK
jgi:HTH-type transcriptional regulator, sugar sensing transcriptional regulator